MAKQSKKNLNDRALKALKPAKAGQRYAMMDTVVPGFGVRVTDKATKTFILVARYPGSSNPTRRSLGEYGAIGLADAREKARKWISLIEKGVDPQVDTERQRLAEQRNRASTFAAAAEDFLEHISDQRRVDDVERTMRRVFIPKWGDRPISEIDRFDVQSVIESTVRRGKRAMAHLEFAHIRRFFNFAVARERYGIDRSPCDRIAPADLIGEKRHRDRVLDDDELRALWRAAGTLGYPFGSAVQVLMLTGQRKSEVAEAQWGEFDLGKAVWTIPPTRMKADAPHVVPLTDDVLKVLQGLPRFKGGDFVFSYDFGASAMHVSTKSKRRLDAAMAVALGREVEPFVLHDIRRTVRTNLPRLRVPTEISELVIGHTKQGLHKVYDQYAYLDEKREALTLWATHLRSIVAPPAAAVVKIKARGVS
jgi:integrase